MDEKVYINAIEDILNGAVGEYRELAENYERCMALAVYILCHSITDEQMREIANIFQIENNE